MTKALFSEKQPEVRITPGDLTTVQIAMNGKNVTQETDDGTKYTEYQYDYNEFRGVDGQNFNTEKIKESPSDYLEFSVPEQNVVGPVPVPTIKAMQSQIDSLESVVADLIGGAE